MIDKGDAEEVDPKQLLEEKERLDAMEEQENERKAKHQKVEVEREKERQRIRDKVKENTKKFRSRLKFLFCLIGLNSMFGLLLSIFILFEKVFQFFSFSVIYFKVFRIFDLF